MTFLLLTLSFFYAVIKTIHLVERANPVMSELKIPDNYSSTDKFFLAENNFKMAFAVEGYQDEENKNDPRYVKWFVRVVNTLDGQYGEKILPYRKCTDKDYAEFNPVAKKSAPALKSIREDPKRGLYCIDWTDDLYIMGEKKNPQYQRIELLFVPCNYIHQYYGYTEDSVSDECIRDIKKQQEYLTSLKFLIYFNDEEFDQQEFNDESIKRTSKLKYYQFKENTPTWFDYYVQTRMISDETQLVQFGNSVDREYNSFVDNITPLVSSWSNFPTDD